MTISMPTIINAILQGFVEAQQSYEDMSGGFWLWNAPEYFITSTVAKNIYAIDGGKYLTLEHGSTDAIKDAGAKGRGRLPKDIREKGRVDVLLWWANSTPRAIIEIKNQIYSKDQYEKDIKRIKSFLGRNSVDSSLQFGVFAFYESAFNGVRKTAKEKIEGRIDRILDNSKLILGENFDVKLYVTDMHEESENAWQAACLFIKFKNA
jgi:hypothetical protein